MYREDGGQKHKMALVKPDETIIGGGGTTNTSQRGIYIT